MSKSEYRGDSELIPGFAQFKVKDSWDAVHVPIESGNTIHEFNSKVIDDCPFGGKFEADKFAEGRRSYVEPIRMSGACKVCIHNVSQEGAGRLILCNCAVQVGNKL